MQLGVDVGGTFTDAVLFDGGEVHTAKAPTTPTDEEAGVASAVAAVLKRAGVEAKAVKAFAHGMTVGTNALLTERGARSPSSPPRGSPTCSTSRARTGHGSMTCAQGGRVRWSTTGCALPRGSGSPPPAWSLRSARRRSPASSRRSAIAARESVAVCTLFAHVDPAHEQALAEALRERLVDVHVSASHEVLAQFREYERCSTTVIDAYLSPLLADYLRRLEAACEEAGLPEPAVMKSSGGVAPVDEVASSGAQTVLSGPAGGAVGAALLARLSGDGNAVGLDMGGTSCDVCVVSGGAVRRTDSRTIGGRVIQLPMVDVHTVGAGGGSVAWRDEGGALRVGPRSAGAEPGPACYGRGGTEPTVTDANLLLGYLPPGSELAGGVRLDVDAARRPSAELAGKLGLDETATAEGIVRVANQEMVRALRVEHGGARRGPTRVRPHAVRRGRADARRRDRRELGMRTILCPRAGGVLSALGLLSSERRRDTARTVMLRGDELTTERIAEEVEALRAAIARRWRPPGARPSTRCATAARRSSSRSPAP